MWSGGSRLRGFRRDEKGFACKRIGGLQDVGESRPLRQNTNARVSGRFYLYRFYVCNADDGLQNAPIPAIP
jgi:hypothetical protein